MAEFLHGPIQNPRSRQLQDGTRFRSLTIASTCIPREAVAIDAGQSLNGDNVVRALNRLKSSRGVPEVLCCDNGSEFTTQAMAYGVYKKGTRMTFPARAARPTKLS